MSHRMMAKKIIPVSFLVAGGKILPDGVPKREHPFWGMKKPGCHYARQSGRTVRYLR